MPFFFALIGIGLLVIGYRGTQAQFFQLVKGDFSGPGNFFVFALGIFVVGLVGYVPKLKGVSDAFLGLVIITMILANRGFFKEFLAQVQGTQTNATATATVNTNGFSTGSFPAIPPIPSIPNLFAGLH